MQSDNKEEEDPSDRGMDTERWRKRRQKKVFGNSDACAQDFEVLGGRREEDNKERQIKKKGR